MKRFQLLLIAVGVVILGLVFAQPVRATIQTLQTQIFITVVVNVTPSPIGYLPHQAPVQNGQPVITSISLGRALPANRAFRAEGLHFTGDSTTVAQAQVQHGVLVQAEVTPNPKGTLLYSNQSSVTANIIAGTSMQIVCAFTVTVDSTKAWSLDEGLATDFSGVSDGDPVGFSGTNLANDTYKATPLPTSTPYVVYEDDGSKWSLVGTGSVMTTYCVTLTITVPGSTLAGPYSTNAVYSLYQ